MKSLRNCRTDASATSPSGLKIAGSYLMYASGAVIWRALQYLRTPRSDCWAKAVPI